MLPIDKELLSVKRFTISQDENEFFAQENENVTIVPKCRCGSSREEEEETEMKEIC